MTADQLDLIPDQLLRERGTRGLREWLWQRGATLTLLELESERRRRGLIGGGNRAAS
jgi:hypothetical protein